MNLRPPGYEPDELPAAPPRDISYLVVYAAPCCLSIGAGDRGRTGTIGKDRRILSPVRLPIPPPRHGPWFYIGKAEDGVRTRDPHLGKVVFYH